MVVYVRRLWGALRADAAASEVATAAAEDDVADDEDDPEAAAIEAARERRLELKRHIRITGNPGLLVMTMRPSVVIVAMSISTSSYKQATTLESLPWPPTSAELVETTFTERSWKPHARYSLLRGGIRRHCGPTATTFSSRPTPPLVHAMC